LTFVFFTDRDLGTRFPEILKGAGLALERHADHFRPDCPDEEWLAEVGKREWVALTHDARIRYKPNERAAVIRHRVRIIAKVYRATPTELAENPAASGRIERWYPR